MTKLDKFIVKAITRFGDKFDYSKTVYSTSEGKVIITCPIHGDITIAPYSFLHSPKGCQRCSKENMSNKWTTEKFIDRSKQLFGLKFDYSATLYLGSKKYLDIDCPLHGTFTQMAEKHLASKHGCPGCASTHTSKRLTNTTGDFIRNATKIHGDNFDYSAVKYTDYKTFVTIKCNTCLGVFNQTPNSHLNGNGCTTCSTSGFDD